MLETQTLLGIHRFLVFKYQRNIWKCYGKQIFFSNGIDTIKSTYSCPIFCTNDASCASSLFPRRYPSTQYRMNQCISSRRTKDTAVIMITIATVSTVFPTCFRRTVRPSTLVVGSIANSLLNRNKVIGFFLEGVTFPPTDFKELGLCHMNSGTGSSVIVSHGGIWTMRGCKPETLKGRLNPSLRKSLEIYFFYRHQVHIFLRV